MAEAFPHATTMHAFPLRTIPAFLAALALQISVAQQATECVHFKPPNHLLGDVHPYFHNGTCYLYYLKPEKYESALACSRDWLRWTETPITLAPPEPGDWTKPYFVLGVIRDESTNSWRSFFGHLEGRIASSMSNDLLHWSCAPKEYHVPPGNSYVRRRDPFVFWIPESKQWGCVMTTKMKGRPDHQAGAVSLATSPDLKQWTDHGAILDPGNIGEPECPQMFRLGSKWYLLASVYDRAVGKPVYWIGENPFGPWGEHGPYPLDGKDLCAAQIGFDGDTPILFGWIPRTPARPGAQTWGGHLALPREVISMSDGTLGTRLPAKLREAFARLPWQSVPGFPLTSEPRECAGDWHNLAAEFSPSLPEESGEVRVRFEPLGEVVLSHSKIQVLDGRGECWSEMALQLPGHQAIPVSLFIDGDLVEVFANSRHSVAARLPAVEGTCRLSFRSPSSGAHILSLKTSNLRIPPQ